MNFADPIRIDEHLTLADRALAAPMAGQFSARAVKRAFG